MSDHSKQFDEGFRAYHAGKSMDANPYDAVMQADERDSWAAGYLHADYLATPITERVTVEAPVYGEVVA